MASSRLRPGFLLLEMMVGIGVFAVFLTAVSLVLLGSQESTKSAGDRVRASFLSEEAIEAARAIRDGGFSSLAAGEHGVGLGATGRWTFSGSLLRSSGGYVTVLALSAAETGRMRLAAQTRWQHERTRSGSVLFESDLTDWRGTRYAGDWSSPVLEGSYAASGTPQFAALALAGDVAFLAGAASPGLTLVDVSTASAPQRIAASFALPSGAGAADAAAKGQRLYVLTTDSSSELQEYDISSPADLASGDLVASYDLPGGALGTSLALDGNILFVTAKTGGTGTLYSFDVSDSGSIVPLGSAAGSADANMVALSGTSAYLATSNLTAELGVVNVEDPAAPAFATDEGYNVTGALQALSIAVSGSAALLGQEQGSSNVVLFNVASGGIPVPPSPLFHSGSGSIVSIDIDPSGCYAFLGAASGHKAVQVVDIHNTSLPEIASYQTTGSPLPARAVFYDPPHDLLYVLTSQSLVILKPNSSIGSCP